MLFVFRKLWIAGYSFNVDWVTVSCFVLLLAAIVALRFRHRRLAIGLLVITALTLGLGVFLLLSGGARYIGH